MMAFTAVSCLLGCSTQALKRTGYEALNNISDIQNEKDPRYGPGQRPSFETYQQRREEILRDQQGDFGSAITPNAQANP